MLSSYWSSLEDVLKHRINENSMVDVNDFADDKTFEEERKCKTCKEKNYIGKIGVCLKCYKAIKNPPWKGKYDPCHFNEPVDIDNCTSSIDYHSGYCCPRVYEKEALCKECGKMRLLYNTGICPKCINKKIPPACLACHRGIIPHTSHEGLCIYYLEINKDTCKSCVFTRVLNKDGLCFACTKDPWDYEYIKNTARYTTLQIREESKNVKARGFDPRFIVFDDVTFKE